MSWKAVNAAWKVRGLKVSEKCVLVCMADHASQYEADTTFVSQETIADECGISERTVIRIQKSLVLKKHISAARRIRRAAFGAARTTFSVHPVTGDNLSPVTSDNGGSDTRQLKLRQVTTAAPTGDNDDTPNITILNPLNQRGTDAPSLSASERITLAKSLDRVHGRLAELKGADLPKAVEERKMLIEERKRLLKALGLKA